MHSKAPEFNPNDPVARESHVWVGSKKAKRPNGLRCHYCTKYAENRDHVVPKKLGGLDHFWNLVPSCVSCNNSKGGEAPTCSCPFCSRAVTLWRAGHRKPTTFRKATVRKVGQEWRIVLPSRVKVVRSKELYRGTWREAMEVVDNREKMG